MRGLDQTEAKRRLAQDGPNELPSGERRSVLRIAAEVLREPMFGLLLAAATIYLALGSLTEGLALLVLASLSVSISIVQETRSERVLDALRTLSSPRALVIRDGQHQRIPGREVVRGDLIVLAEGDRVPADGAVIEAHDLLVDESLLTGESVAVRKRARRADDAASHRPGGDDLPAIFSGSLVVRGSGSAEVQATGARSQIGIIGRSLSTVDVATPRLTAQTRRLVRVFAVVGLLACAIAVSLHGLRSGEWLQASLAGIALGMSMLPEEFPLVLAVFMVAGAWRISRVRVLTRRSSAIEALGAATVLCTDKTGTLTQNRMSVVELWSDAGRADRAFLLKAGALASAPEGFDPMDRAIRAETEGDPAGGLRLERRYGLTPERLAVIQVWRPPDSGSGLVAAKGAPEAIISLSRLDHATTTKVQQAVDAMAARGIRVLGVATAEIKVDELPEDPAAYAFSFVGLIGLADPLRDEVPEAIAQCRHAGIRVIMVTGDYPATAGAIARAAGLAHGVIATGEELARLDDRQLGDLVGRADVFARIMPEQKLRIVKALQADGEVVAMTGDGVNDAPSLKSADIGIAMGSRGTDVAREASSLVLLDDDFGSIVRTVRLGRRIYDNLRKAMSYVMAVHVPIAGTALLPLLTGHPLVLFPLHIAIIEMIIDPTCAIAFEAEPEERDLMDRPPRAPDAKLFTLPMIAWNLVQGLTAFGAVATVYAFALIRGLPDEDVRSLSFFTLVLANLALIVINRSNSGSAFDFMWGRNPVLLGIAAAALAVLAITVAWDPARVLFGFGPIHADDLGLVALAVMLLIGVLFLLKPLAKRAGV